MENYKLKEIRNKKDEIVFGMTCYEDQEVYLYRSVIKLIWSFIWKLALQNVIQRFQLICLIQRFNYFNDLLNIVCVYLDII